jgi:hypothetical protein
MDEQKYCKNCGAAISLGAAFCAECGSKTFIRPTSPSSAPLRSTLVVRSTSPSSAPPPPTSQPSSAPPPPTSQPSSAPPRSTLVVRSTSSAPPRSTSQGPSDYQRPYAPPPKAQRRFKKRYVLYCFVVLIVLGMAASALQGPSQSTQSNASTTPAPTAANANGNDPLLSAIAANLQSGESAHNPTVTNWKVLGGQNPVYVLAQYQTNPNAFIDISNAPTVGNYSQVTINERWTVNGVQRGRVALITNEISTANATADFKFQTALAGTSGAVSDGHETAYAQSEVASALGHTPATVNDLSWHYSGEGAAQREYIQYDNILILLSQNLGITGDSGPTTP